VVVLTDDANLVLFPDIEASRVETEERFEQIGFQSISYAWHEGPVALLDEILDGRPTLRNENLETVIAPHRRQLGSDELERYRGDGDEVARVMVEAIRTLDPGMTERDVAADLAARLQQRGFFAPVLLVAGEERQPLHRHPLPTDAVIGRHGLLAVTAERHGLHVSMTRLVSFGAAPRELLDLTRKASFVDAAALAASRPGRTLGEAFASIEEAYAAHGVPGEWRRHHQGGLTGYAGREVFAIPGDRTVILPSAAVAWNPSITGGAKSEDTALVTEGPIEVITRTPDLPEFNFGVVPRPAIVEL
jgi:Xaa-Pro aminopeptidase